MSGELMSCIPPRWNWGMLIPASGYGRCYRCRRPWWLVNGHIVWLHPPGTTRQMDAVAGLHAVCTRCWPRMSIEGRIEAHRWVTRDLWAGSNVERWEEIVAAVRRG